MLHNNYYIVTFVYSQRLDGFGFMNEVGLTYFPKTITFISKAQFIRRASAVQNLILHFSST